jgi:hypothetical protein
MTMQWRGRCIVRNALSPLSDGRAALQIQFYLLLPTHHVHILPPFHTLFTQVAHGTHRSTVRCCTHQSHNCGCLQDSYKRGAP